MLEQKISQEYVSVEAFETLMRATVIAFMARSDVARMAYAWAGVGWAPSSMPMQNHPKWFQNDYLSLAAHMILNHPYGSGQDSWLTFVILCALLETNVTPETEKRKPGSTFICKKRLLQEQKTNHFRSLR